MTYQASPAAQEVRGPGWRESSAAEAAAAGWQSEVRPARQATGQGGAARLSGSYRLLPGGVVLAQRRRRGQLQPALA